MLAAPGFVVGAWLLSNAYTSFMHVEFVILPFATIEACEQAADQFKNARCVATGAEKEKELTEPLGTLKENTFDPGIALPEQGHGGTGHDK